MLCMEETMHQFVDGQEPIIITVIHSFWKRFLLFCSLVILFSGLLILGVPSDRICYGLVHSRLGRFQALVKCQRRKSKPWLIDEMIGIVRCGKWPHHGTQENNQGVCMCSWHDTQEFVIHTFALWVQRLCMFHAIPAWEDYGDRDAFECFFLFEWSMGRKCSHSPTIKVALIGVETCARFPSLTLTVVDWFISSSDCKTM